MMRFKLAATLLLCCFSPSVLGAGDENEGDVGITMDNSLSFAGKGSSFDLGRLGMWEVNAAASAMAFSQNNPTANAGDISNAQLLIQKSEGEYQFSMQTGLYTTPVLGKTIDRTLSNTVNTFGYIPLAAASYVPNKNWSITAGKIPSMGGYESNMTFQNLNIQRGLLWDQTSSVSYGGIVNYKKDQVSLDFTWNNGYYSNKMNWLGISGGYQLNGREKMGLSWVGSTSPNSQNTPNTPLLQNNSQIVNALYSYNGDHWYLAPYLQYTLVPVNQSIGITSEYQTYGAAILANYRFAGVSWPGLSNAKMSLPVRLEFIQAKGGIANSINPMLFGPNSAAASFTITPTIQLDKFFARAEGSLVQLINPEQGLAFGSNNSQHSQIRVMLEVGLLY